MKRKSPRRHKVKFHLRKNKPVREHARGKGVQSAKKTLKKRVLRSPRRDFKHTSEGLFWKIDGEWKHFQYITQKPTEKIPKDAKVIKFAYFDDHKESLLFDGKNYYQVAGGGRGFYWSKRLKEIK